MHTEIEMKKRELAAIFQEYALAVQNSNNNRAMVRGARDAAFHALTSDIPFAIGPQHLVLRDFEEKQRALDNEEIRLGKLFDQLSIEIAEMYGAKE